jgi:hypothetical protein
MLLACCVLARARASDRGEGAEARAVELEFSVEGEDSGTGHAHAGAGMATECASPPLSLRSHKLVSAKKKKSGAWSIVSISLHLAQEPGTPVDCQRNEFYFPPGTGLLAWVVVPNV